MNAIQEKLTANKGIRIATMLLGTIVGALPGVVVLVCISSLGRISSLSGVAIMAGAILGYAFSKMPMGKAGFLYIFTVNLAMILLGETIAVYVEYVSVFLEYFGWELFWDIATSAAPRTLFQSGDWVPIMLANAGLGILFSIPVGYPLYASIRKRREQPASIPSTMWDDEPVGYVPTAAVFDDAPRRASVDRSPLTLRCQAIIRVFAWTLVVLSLSLIGYCIFYPENYLASGLGTYLLIWAMALFLGVVAFYLLTLRFCLTDEGLTARRFFRVRSASYIELHDCAKSRPPALKGRALVLYTDKGPIRLSIVAWSEGGKFVRALAARANIPIPWEFYDLHDRQTGKRR